MARATSLATLLFGLGLGLGLGLVACAEEDAGVSSAPSPEGREHEPRPAAPTPGPDVPIDTSVVVAHDRELRGAWISTVYNGTWPSRTGLTAVAAKSELLAIFDALASARMNAVFFQVRAESDAVYASAIEPWSRFLTGKQGVDPGWDPLAFAVEEGHKRGLEVHAWMNPYRGLVSTQIEVAASHVTKMLPSAARGYGSLVWMDPGVPEVRAHILDVVRDVVMRYDVDGVHFDDYFYPYPVAGQTFDDAAAYQAYTGAGGALAKDDWRRSNVDALVRETSEVVMKTRASVRFGVSPFGIYRPGTPPGITGLDAYATLYCDPVRWMDEAWVDYLAPQLYWPTTQTAQAFGELATWWAGIAKAGRSIFVGHDATKAGEGAFSLDEYDKQMKLVAAERARGARGSIFFSAKPLVEDRGGLRSALAATHWATPAATPPLALAALEPAGPAPKVRVAPRAASVTLPAGARSLAVYRERAGGAYAVERIVGVGSPAPAGSEIAVALDAGAWAISVIDRRGVESRGARITVE
ncbi:MAG: family 10 glycosylhydrolase [Labilithrix sp.]|nr:family 10 glycosylhydrolase [Labilithrix sp.]